MHPDIYQLAAYLDGVLDEAERATTRAHILTCPVCAARLERLRDDAQRIATYSAGPAPDVRAAVRARLRRGSPLAWLARGGALAGGLAALLMFALLIGISRGGAVGRVPDRLFVVDKQARQLFALDTNNGAVLNSVAIGDQPARIEYDRRHDRLYVMLEQAIVGVDARTLAVVNRWDAPQPFDVYSGMALDERHGRLYVAQPVERSIALLDTATFTSTMSFYLGSVPNELALTPDGGTLFALDGDGMLWTINTLTGEKSAQSLAGGAVWQRGWLAVSPDGQTVYALRSGAPPTLLRIDAQNGEISDPVPLADGSPPQDLLLLDAGHLAIARGNGKIGGVEIVATGDFSATAWLSPDRDEHHLAAGPAGTLFGLKFTSGRLTRFDTNAQKVVWRTPESDTWHPWEAVFVPGGWRWPW